MAGLSRAMASWPAILIQGECQHAPVLLVIDDCLSLYSPDSDVAIFSRAASEVSSALLDRSSLLLVQLSFACGERVVLYSQHAAEIAGSVDAVLQAINGPSELGCEAALIPGSTRLTPEMAPQKGSSGPKYLESGTATAFGPSLRGLSRAKADVVAGRAAQLMGALIDAGRGIQYSVRGRYGVSDHSGSQEDPSGDSSQGHTLEASSRQLVCWCDGQSVFSAQYVDMLAIDVSFEPEANRGAGTLWLADGMQYTFFTTCHDLLMIMVLVKGRIRLQTKALMLAGMWLERGQRLVGKSLRPGRAPPDTAPLPEVPVPARPEAMMSFAAGLSAMAPARCVEAMMESAGYWTSRPNVSGGRGEAGAPGEPGDRLEFTADEAGALTMDLPSAGSLTGSSFSESCEDQLSSEAGESRSGATDESGMLNTEGDLVLNFGGTHGTRPGSRANSRHPSGAQEGSEIETDAHEKADQTEEPGGHLADPQRFASGLQSVAGRTSQKSRHFEPPDENRVRFPLEYRGTESNLSEGHLAPDSDAQGCSRQGPAPQRKWRRSGKSNPQPPALPDADASGPPADGRGHRFSRRARSRPSNPVQRVPDLSSAPLPIFDDPVGGPRMRLANQAAPLPEDREWERDPAIVKSLRCLCQMRDVMNLSLRSPARATLVCNRSLTTRKRLVLTLGGSSGQSRDLEIRHFAHLPDTSSLPAVARAKVAEDPERVPVRVESANAGVIVLLMERDDFEELNVSANSLLSCQQ